MRNDSISRRARAQAHSKHAYFCACGKVVHGNGARAMHFYVRGDRYLGRREGHAAITRDGFFRRFPSWTP